MSPELLSQWAGTAVVGLLVWSLGRNVAAVDAKLSEMSGKVDALHKSERDIQVRVAELSVRVTHTEAMLANVEVQLAKMRGVQP